MTTSINTHRAPAAVGAYPHARRVGDLLFLSGVGPRSRGSKEIPGVSLNDAGEIVSYDIEEQCRSVFQNVRYILEDAGSSWENIVDVTVFLTNMKADFAAYVAKRKSSRPAPAPSGPPPEAENAPRSDWLTGVQYRLKYLAYYSGEVHGINDQATKNAVRAFQTDQRIMIDGIPGPQTQAELVAVCGF